MGITIRDIQSAVGVAALYGASIVGLVWAATFEIAGGREWPPAETVGGLPIAMSSSFEEAECECGPCRAGAEEVAALAP